MADCVSSPGQEPWVDSVVSPAIAVPIEKEVLLIVERAEQEFGASWVTGLRSELTTFVSIAEGGITSGPTTRNGSASGMEGFIPLPLLLSNRLTRSDNT